LKVARRIYADSHGKESKKAPPYVGLSRPSPGGKIGIIEAISKILD